MKSSEVVPVIAVAQASSTVEVPVSSVEAAYSDDSSMMSNFSITPFVGKRWLYDSGSEFSATNIFSTGVNIEGRVAQYLGVEGNFSFGRDEFSYNGYGAFGSVMAPGGSPMSNYIGEMRTRDTFEFGSNLIVGPNSNKFRPYALVGLGVQYNRYNIDDEFTKQQLESIGWQRATTHFFNNFGGGMDYKVSKNFGVGARVDYQHLYGSDSEMDQIWGDNRDSLRGTANLSLQF